MDGRKLFVGFLPRDVNKTEVEDIFSKYGEVESVKIKNRRRSSIAFVAFKTSLEAERARRTLHGATFRKCKMKVDFQRIHEIQKSHDDAPVIQSASISVGHDSGLISYPVSTVLDGITVTVVQSGEISSMDADNMNSFQTVNLSHDETIVVRRPKILRDENKISPLLNCIGHMKWVVLTVEGKQYWALLCDQDNLFRMVVSDEFPDQVLVRKSTLDIIQLIETLVAHNSEVTRILVTGTPGVGTTVSIIVWLFMIFTGAAFKDCDHVIADLKSACYQFDKNSDGNWRETCFSDRFFDVNKLLKSKSGLYLYDAAMYRYPMNLPNCVKIVFSPPNLRRFKDFIDTVPYKQRIFYLPMWTWGEFLAYYSVTEKLQSDIKLDEKKELFTMWGGVPRRISMNLEQGRSTLNYCLTYCNPSECKQLVKREFFDNDDSPWYTSFLMHLEVVEDGEYETARTIFGSKYFIDELLAKESGSQNKAYEIGFLDLF